MIYRTCVFAGVITGLALSAAYASRAGLTPALWIAAAALAICVALLLAVATKVLFGRETFSFLHYQIAAIATVAIFVPIRGALDLLALALAVTQSIGRIGCAAAGCCHGRPSRFGIRYDDAHVPSHWAGVRLFPVQWVESAFLAAIAIVTATLIGRTGAALAFYASAYAAVRFALEILRGDARRHLFSLSEAQWICLGIILWQRNWIVAGAMLACGAAIVIRGRVDADAIARARRSDAMISAAGIRVSHGVTNGAEHYTISGTLKPGRVRRIARLLRTLGDHHVDPIVIAGGNGIHHVLFAEGAR